MKRPTGTQVREWVKTSWQSVQNETLVRSFKKCGTGSALDGSEDAILQEQSADSDTSDSEGLSFINVDSGDGVLGVP